MAKCVVCGRVHGCVHEDIEERALIRSAALKRDRIVSAVPARNRVIAKIA